MIKINCKSDCCGCGACSNICPNNCITMVSDNEGFLYPKIDEQKCINCNLCESTCPFKDKNNSKNKIISAYAIQAKDSKILKNVASGGCYTVLAEYFIQQHGLSIGVTVENGEVCHTVAKDLLHVEKHSSSKYVQSHTKNIYKITKEYLEINPDKIVLFSGTPCQIAALKLFLKKEYNNLYLIDIVCAGVCSPKVFEQYINKMERKYSGNVLKSNFKEKTYGYHSSTMKLCFDNGKSYSHSRLTDPMMKIFTAHIADRPSCSKCKIKGYERYSDLTIFDCWHFTALTGKKDNDLGHTNVLVHTEKGKGLLDSCSKMFDIDVIDIDKAITLDGNMVCGIQKPHDKRKQFFDVLNEKGIDCAILECIPITTKDKLGELVKPILYKLGILEDVKKARRK